MKRKTLTILVGGIGTVLALAMLIGMSLMGSLLADARTENLSGPGVDVFLRTPFPGPGSRVVLEITARGGSRAGIRGLVVRHGDTVLVEERGAGATWGRTITSGKSRGAKSTEVSFAVPEGVKAGETLPLVIDVAYVVAMKRGVGTFGNDEMRGTVRLDVKVYSPGGRALARTGIAARAAALFLVWFLLVWGVTYLFVRDAELHGADTGSHEDAEFAGIGLLMGLMGGGFVGYWLFARPLMAAWATVATAWSVTLTALWMLLPLGWVFLWHRRRPKYERYRCALSWGAAGDEARRVDVGPGGAHGPELDPAEVIPWLDRDLGYRVRAGEGRLQARKGKTCLRIRWSGRRIAVDGLILEATETQAAAELAHRIAERVGPLDLITSRGALIHLEPGKTVAEAMAAYTEAMLAEARRLLDALGSLRLPTGKK